jgi:hypothetical protein
MSATLSASGRRTIPEPQVTAVDGQHTLTRKHAKYIHRIVLKRAHPHRVDEAITSKSCISSRRSSGNRCEILEL